uniref:Transcription initiation factor TFIID subunit 10 n=1 Tax=Parastrongyloides trichosuri TaxID=131310 RepID=A0A0N5A669_PARTI
MNPQTNPRPEMVAELRKQACAPEIDVVYQFLDNLNKFNSVIPESVSTYYLSKSGVDCNDKIVPKMIAVSTQKFISDILLDCMTQAKHRGLGTTKTNKKGAKETKYTLTMDVLETVLKEYGIEPLPPVNIQKEKNFK